MCRTSPSRHIVHGGTDGWRAARASGRRTSARVSAGSWRGTRRTSPSRPAGCPACAGPGRRGATCRSCFSWGGHESSQPSEGDVRRPVIRPTPVGPNPIRPGRSAAVRWSHRRSSRHQRRASGRTVPAPRASSVDPDGWARHSRERAVAPSARRSKRGGTAVPELGVVLVVADDRSTAGDSRMTYPKVSTDPTPPRRRRPVEPPRSPQIEERVLAYWEAGRHLPGQRRAARRRRERRQRVRLLRRPAVRQRPAALRPPADRLRQGPDPALPDDARPPGRAPLRLGHPRPARRARGDAPARHQDHRRDPRAGHREVQRRPAARR